MTLDWKSRTLEADCPVCLQNGAMLRVVETHSIAPGGGRVAFVRCPDCASVFTPGHAAPDYASDASSAEIARYYVEQLAAIDTIVDPLFKLEASSVRHYAEIGCGFGFSLDFARGAFGWTVRGIEPGPMGALGAATLDLDVESRLFDEANPLGPPQAELLFASEVIEHIADPHAFLRGVCASLAPSGVLVLSTPHARAVRPETEAATLAQVLCPGYHLVLFTPESLTRLLEAHGFVHHQHTETPDGFTVYASRERFGFTPERSTDRSLYAAYLERRLESAAPGSALERGMAFRLLREHTMFARWDAAEAMLPHLCTIFRAAGIDLLEPARARPSETIADFQAFARAQPLNLAGVFHALGLLELLHRRDDACAVAFFDASAAWAQALRRVLLRDGIGDAGLLALERDARMSALQAQARADPIDAVARLLRFEAEVETAADLELAGRIRRDLFVELVSHGRHGLASRLADAVAGALSLAAAGTIRPEGRCRGCYAVGIHALHHLHAPAIARHWLAQAADVGRTAPDHPVVQDFAAAATRALSQIAPERIAVAAQLRSWLRRAG